MDWYITDKMYFYIRVLHKNIHFTDTSIFQTFINIAASLYHLPSCIGRNGVSWPIIMFCMTNS